MVGPDSGLRRAIAADRVPSMIFFGPPGSGKTTLARIVAHSTRADFVELSAVQTGVADVRRVLAQANERLGASGQRSILFLDEIHRFNKGQQDALLPAVESGLVTLIGATTENPYFEVNSALLSRCQLYQLDAIDREALGRIVERGAAELGVSLADGVRETIVSAAGGDGRNALNIIEAAAAIATDGVVSAADVADAARKAPLLYDKGGDRHYDTISAFIKSMRGSDADASVYYLAVMIAGGEDPKFLGPADDRVCLRRRRQRRPAGARGGCGHRSRGRVRGAARVPHQPLPVRRLPGAGAQVERGLQGDLGGTRPTCASAARCARRRTCATAHTPGQGAGARRRLPLPAQRPRRAADQQYLPDELAEPPLPQDDWPMHTTSMCDRRTEAGQPHRMRLPKAEQASSTARLPVALCSSSTGFTSTISSEVIRSRPARVSIARCASR